MTQADIFIEYPYELLSYMREIHKPVFHNSNIFFRDLQFSIQEYFEDKQGITIGNEKAETIAKDVARSYEQTGIFKRVNPQGYILNYPELSTPKEGGTIAAFQGVTPDAMPPARVVASPAPAPAAAKPAAATAPKAAAPSSSTPAVAGATPAGAKAPPPWLKK